MKNHFKEIHHSALFSLHSRGFTLIELLVVIAIMATLVVVLLPQLNKFNRSQTLQTAAAKLQSDFRAAQNNASSGVECRPSVKASDWHLLVVNSSGYKVEPTCTGATPITHALPTGVKIYSVKLNTCSEITATGNGSNLANFGVIYKNISAGVTFQSADLGCPISSATNQLILKLILDDDVSKYMKVIVEKGGSVYLSSN